MSPKGIALWIAGAIGTVFVLPILSSAAEQWSKDSGLEPRLVSLLNKGSYLTTLPGFWYAASYAFGFACGVAVFWYVNKHSVAEMERVQVAQKAEMKLAWSTGQDARSLAQQINAAFHTVRLDDDRSIAASIEATHGPTIMSLFLNFKKLGIPVEKPDLKSKIGCLKFAEGLWYLGQLLVDGHLDEARHPP